MVFKAKVWIAIAVCLFVLPLFASLAQDNPSGEATPEATVEATTEATPEATPGVEVTVEPGTAVIIIVIEGPVEAINVNIITIFDIDIEVDADDPVLTVIQIGDVLRISGELPINDDDQGDEDEGTHMRLIAIIIIFVDVDVVVVDGQVWRDRGNCDNPPPPWAPAHGWHRRCDHPVVTTGGGGGTTIIIIGGDGGSGKGMGMGR